MTRTQISQPVKTPESKAEAICLLL